MSEAMEQPSIQAPILRPNQFELSVPRNEKGERIGTGAMVEPLRPGLPGETVRSTILKALFRTGRNMQAPRGVAEQAANRTDHGFVTEQERAIAAARKQELQTREPAQRQPNAELPQLSQADRNQTEQKLDATRSALKNEVAQAEPSEQQPQDRNEGAKQQTEKKPQQATELIHFYDRRDGSLIASLQLPKNYTAEDVNRTMRESSHMKGYTFSSERTITPQPPNRSESGKKSAEHSAQEEPETEPVKFYHAKDGHLLFTIQLPKGGKYTTADVNRAARAVGINYTYSPAWTPGGWHMRGRDIGQAAKDMWQIITKTWQTSAPPEAQQPEQKAA